ncbi:MAG: DUF1737 domain-containing protein [Alphaproteobacteria bacterium]|nr:DUF1737 domain-containing protein [Alphaproteobacteria bacterium]
MVEVKEKLPYRLLTGVDDAQFCRRVSQALEDGYELYGSPAIAFDGQENIVAQAVVLKPVGKNTQTKKKAG